MSLQDQIAAMVGNENVEIFDYATGDRLFLGTLGNVPQRLRDREVKQIRLVPQKYLGIVFFIQEVK